MPDTNNSTWLLFSTKYSRIRNEEQGVIRGIKVLVMALMKSFRKRVIGCVPEFDYLCRHRIADSDLFSSTCIQWYTSVVSGMAPTVECIIIFGGKEGEYYTEKEKEVLSLYMRESPLATIILVEAGGVCRWRYNHDYIIDCTEHDYLCPLELGPFSEFVDGFKTTFGGLTGTPHTGQEG